MGFFGRLQHGWNAFINNRDPTTYYRSGPVYHSRPDRAMLSRGNERSFITSIFNRISLDVADLEILHVRLDEDGQIVETMNSGLNNCLSVEANLDQTGRACKQDIVMSMLDEGCVAIVPVDTTTDPTISGSYDIDTIRTGRIVDWAPEDVKINLYNEKTAQKKDIILPKKAVAIVENPLFAVVNAPNSTLQRLIRKLNLLDAIDEQSGSGKLDLIIQLPYVIKSPTRKSQAEQRRKDIEDQLSGSKYGIAYTDGTERITQLNRPVENNLMKQIEYLTNQVYSQLGITQGVMDGSADEQTMLNYYNRTVNPIAAAIVDEMKRKFLTKTARSQRQSIIFVRDYFKFATLGQMSDAADTLTRNEIFSKNEIRRKFGMRPSKDPKADQLINSNINQANNAPAPTTKVHQDEPENNNKEGENQNG